jgi:hypothetical protein
MRSIKHRFMSIKKIGLYVLLICLNLVSVSCDASQSKIGSWLSDRLPSSVPSIVQPANAQNRLAESAPPKTIEQLDKKLVSLSPKVAILEPQNDRTYQDTDIKVRLKVDNFQIFQDERWEIGPYLQLIIDDRPGKSIYNLDEPIVLEDLSPGTHNIRVFAARPWQESFKNPEAYAQSTFHILTPTHNNSPSADLPLLTYNSPTGIYTAEPLLLDFYLANTSTHSVARKNSDDKIPNWGVRVTINGETFILENWQSVYLKGFKPGKNWVHLELIDDRGNVIENVYNDTVRWIEYNPQAEELDTLGKLVSDRLSINEVGSIVDPNYRSEPVITENESNTLSETEKPENESEEIVPKTPEVITPAPEVIEPTVTTPKSLEEEVTSQPKPNIQPKESLATETPSVSPKTNIIPPTKPIITETKELLKPETPAIPPTTSNIPPTKPNIEPKEPLKPETPAVSPATNTISQPKPSVSETPSTIEENITEESGALAQTETATNINPVVVKTPQPEETEISPKQQLKVPEWLKNSWQKIQQQFARLPESIDKLKAWILEFKANIMKD